MKWLAEELEDRLSDIIMDFGAHECINPAILARIAIITGHRILIQAQAQAETETKER